MAETVRPLDRRALLLVALALGAIGIALASPPIAQDQAYHRFADGRRFLGVPNALNVLSNLAFVLVGLLGFAFLVRTRGSAPGHPALDAWERAAAWILFAGIALTGAGSAYYHAAPGDATLVWDRLPLAAVVMTLLALVIADRVGPACARALFPALLVAGLASVAYWRATGDLRAYALVQFSPLVAVPVMLALLPGAHDRPGDLVAALGCALAARIFEAGDAVVWALGGVVSGHTLKHLVSAAGAYAVLHWLERRKCR